MTRASDRKSESKPKSGRQASREKSGNMLVIVCVTVALVAVLILVIGSFGMVFFVKNRLQSAADEIALAGAKKLNENDRIGQMNNMLARSRQLVYSSRQNLHQVEAKYIHLEELTDEQLNDGRETAELLEEERKVLLTAAQKEAKDAMIAKFESIKNSFPMVLPWAKIGTPVMNAASDLELGKIVDTESNVTELTGFDELKNDDRSKQYVKVWPKVQLYKAEVDAKLPDEDSSLIYKFSSLIPPVESTVSPARIVLARDFSQTKTGYIPSAAKVKLSLDVATGLGTEAAGNIQAIGCAAATGASYQQ